MPCFKLIILQVSNTTYYEMCWLGIGPNLQYSRQYLPSQPTWLLTCFSSRRRCTCTCSGSKVFDRDSRKPCHDTMQTHVVCSQYNCAIWKFCHFAELWTIFKISFAIVQIKPSKTLFVPGKCRARGCCSTSGGGDRNSGRCGLIEMVFSRLNKLHKLITVNDFHDRSPA